MKTLVQRVTRGRVTVDGQEAGVIGPGLVILIGVRKGDDASAAVHLADKTAHLRIFSDDAGKMNRSLLDVGGEALVISQFTLYGDTKKGHRPSFGHAADPALAETLYEAYASRLREALGTDRVATGVFGAMMTVEIINDGPVTIELTSDR